MPGAWEQAAAWIIETEGGYVFDPSDPGGETKYGISKRTYPFLPISTLTEDEALAVYRRDYWSPLDCERLPGGLALALFDFAVHSGAESAVRKFQLALGKQRGELRVDGVMGSRTLEAAAKAEQHAALVEYLSLRLEFLADRATQPGQGKYRKGWFRRVLQLLSRCEALA